MASTRNVLIDLVQAVGAADWEGAIVTFELETSISVTGNEVVPQYSSTKTTDASGEATAVLVVPTSDAWGYVCTLPLGITGGVAQSFRFNLEAGGDIYLSTLIVAANLDGTVTAGSITVAIDAHEALPDPHTPYLLVTGTRAATGKIFFSGTDHAGIRNNNLTTTERDLLTGQAGDQLFNETTSKLNFYNGSSWGAMGLSDPGTLAVATTNNDDGSNHFHAITTSSDPGAAAAILATNSSGETEIEGLIISRSSDGARLAFSSSKSTIQYDFEVISSELRLHAGATAVFKIGQSNRGIAIGRAGSVPTDGVHIGALSSRLFSPAADTVTLTTPTTGLSVGTLGVIVSNSSTSKTPDTLFHVVSSTTTTAAIDTIAKIEAQSTGTPTVGFGGALLITGETTTTEDQDMVRIGGVWDIATHALRTSDIVFEAVSAAAALAQVFRIGSDGSIVMNVASGDSAPNDDTTPKHLTIQRLTADPTNAAFIKFSNSPGTPTNDFYLVMQEG